MFTFDVALNDFVLKTCSSNCHVGCNVFVKLSICPPCVLGLKLALLDQLKKCLAFIHYSSARLYGT